MKKNSINFFLSLLVILLIAGCSNDRWSYDKQEQWPKKFKGCAGQMQSPIDLSKADTSSFLKPIFFDYAPVDSFAIKLIPDKILKIYVPGTIVVPDSIELGHEFYLVNIHFHTPSEHTVNGKHYPAEIHFVHKDTSGNSATVAVFIEEGQSNEALHTILSNIPEEDYEKTTIRSQLDINMLLPYSTSYWYYAGSKASPPCNEGMQWYVMRQSISASKEQLKKLKQYYPNNNRSIQPLNNRKVYKFGF